MCGDIFSQTLESNIIKKNFLILLSFIFLLAALLSCEKDDNPTSDCGSNNFQTSVVKTLLTSRPWFVSKYQWEDCMNAFTFEPKNGADKICILEYGYVSSDECEEVGDKEVEWVSYEVNFTPSE